MQTFSSRVHEIRGGTIIASANVPISDVHCNQARDTLCACDRVSSWFSMVNAMQNRDAMPEDTKKPEFIMMMK